MTSTQPIILFDKVNKWYGNSYHVLRDIDLNVATGEKPRLIDASSSDGSIWCRIALLARTQRRVESDESNPPRAPTA